MCTFPSWVESEDGSVYFLTDKDVRKYLRTHPEKGWEDMIGHSAIEWVMPEVSGKHEEDLPCPPQVARAIMAGKCERMMEVGGFEHLSLNEAGKLHSFDDKPAIIWTDGTREWRWDGKLHRENDQPAIIWASGARDWWLNGVFIKMERV